MGLTIELSFSITKHANITQFKQILSDVAEKYNSSSSYFIHEIEGHSTTIDRNDCINIVEFDNMEDISSGKSLCNRTIKSSLSRE